MEKRQISNNLQQISKDKDCIFLFNNTIDINKYLNKNCIVVLDNKFKYEGVIDEVKDGSFFINDFQGRIEVSTLKVCSILSKDNN